MQITPLFLSWHRYVIIYALGQVHSMQIKTRLILVLTLFVCLIIDAFVVLVLKYIYIIFLFPFQKQLDRALEETPAAPVTIFKLRQSCNQNSDRNRRYTKKIPAAADVYCRSHLPTGLGHRPLRRDQGVGHQYCQKNWCKVNCTGFTLTTKFSVVAFGDSALLRAQ